MEWGLSDCNTMIISCVYGLLIYIEYHITDNQVVNKMFIIASPKIKNGDN